MVLSSLLLIIFFGEKVVSVSIHLPCSDLSHLYMNDCLLLYKTPQEVDILTRRMENVSMLFEVIGYPVV